MSYEYMRGLVDGEGSFTFSTTVSILADGTKRKLKIPTFYIGMNERDQDLLSKMRDTLGLKNKIYNFKPYLKDGFNRDRRSVFVVREFGSLKNVIIPLFYNKLIGYKRIQFEEWLESIGRDPNVPKSYKLLYRLHKSGFYSEDTRFTV